ncbi:DNA helicase/exodeoxyribonuclease V, gamma subunit [Promicromonospora umidemergens]|uniref:exodeoxyribonuclease V subunit gamma n=1 Tax=Promicromonospora umidemergens TaxID=629679 RepID=UPI0020A33A55|nr:exodeoxyribonuclease V subunit gamma [Promicromonospora umidemergens]MCP2282017.1 DNA helicase/exodeoxyribonuclease V, gamma subunit [Promicromonospora umidemergens]
MPVVLHTASRTDLLVQGLGDLLAVPLADPFATEVVVVPARGVERWLAQRLSHRLGAATGRDDGVCAGVDLRSPGSLFAEVTGTRDDDPWAPEALTWPLLTAIDQSLDEPWAALLAQHLGHGIPGEEGDLRRGRRLAVARRLARLFAGYATQRPALVADWTAGRDTDGSGRPVPADLAWQPPLWRALTEQVDAAPPHVRQAAVVERLGAEPDAFDLPARLSLFGHTRLASSEVELVGALGAHRDVHLWLPHPSAALWSALKDLGGPVDRAADRSHERVGHRLLATLGRDTRELQRTLSAIDLRDEPPADHDDPHPSTLLGMLQHDLRADAVGDAGARLLDPADRSVQVHACHGPVRQVEVLRDVLVGLLADDPTLEPRDVLVMCPDIETYAPLVTAAFGLADVVGPHGHPAHHLRVRLADRALDRTNPLLAVVARLLDLAGGRAGVGDVVDLAHAEPVRRRFGFRDDDLEQLAHWARETGVRWGFDAEHRADFGLADYGAGTWQAGVDRLLAGVAMSDDTGTWLERTLPLDDVGSGQVELVGRLTELVERLRDVTDALVGGHPLEHWLTVLEDGVVALTAVSANDAWQLAQVRRELARVRGAALDPAVTLRLPDVRALLADRVAGRPTRANFRTGTLTVATLVPMRSVPHRVVALLGLDDGVFPRVGSTDGDDVLAREPRTGERDARSEDRQLFLDAILAATETLVVTYSGADEYSGQERPPAVPLGELLDALDETARTPDGHPVSRAVTVRHPLQPFDRRTVEPGALVPGSAFTFDRAALAGARAAAGSRTPVGPFLAEPLPEPVSPGDGVVALDDLLAFYRSPARGFLTQRLDVGRAWEEEPLDDGLPVELDGLDRWAVGERVLRDVLDGAALADAVQKEWRRGRLPPGRLGWRLLRGIADEVGPLAEAAAGLRASPARAVDVDVDLGDGRSLRGTVPGVHGDRPIAVSYSRLGGRQRLQAWVRLLALAASDDDRPWVAYALGRPANPRSPKTWQGSRLGPLDHTAVDLLRDLVALRDRGLTEPLPLPVKASLAYADARRTGSDPADARSRAGQRWSDGRFDGEGSDPEHVRVHGPGAPLPATGEAPRPGEEQAGETTRFGALAVRVWSPLLENERFSD